MDRKVWINQMQKMHPKVHCLTNPVSMQDVANILLAAGGSAIMAQNPAEVQEITAFCQATLLNTGVPDEEKIQACMLAGKKANDLGHPVVLDPVGVGASAFRKEQLERLLAAVQLTVIRCNQEEACTLLRIRSGVSGGVESSVFVDTREQEQIARALAKMYGCVSLVSGVLDVVSDGERSAVIEGGDQRIARITGSGCMLSAVCTLFCGAGVPAYEAACTAAYIWKESARIAGVRTDKDKGGMGSFHVHLFDALDRVCYAEGEDE